MLDFDMRFLYNKRKDVPLLRGRVFLIHHLTYPVLVYSVFKRKLEYITALSFSFYFLATYFAIMACSVYHNSTCEVIDRSVYKRIDYSGVFLCNMAGVFPSIMYYIRSDLHIIMLVFHLLVNVYGALASLNTNLINGTKKLKSTLFWLSHSCNNFVLYNLLREKLYFPSFLFLFGYSLYLCGSIIWRIEKPNLIKNYFEFHELSHFLYVLASHSIFILNTIVTGVYKNNFPVVKW